MGVNKKEGYQTAFANYLAYKSNQQRMIADGIHDYSLLSSLLKINDEIRLHSRFIYSLINPDGLHYCNCLFLKEFLMLIPQGEEIIKRGLFDFENAKVEIEKDNIDLLIHDEKYIFIIENKLNAVDQKHQFTRYIKTVTERFEIYNKENLQEQVFLVYLSKHKPRPSEESESLKGFHFNTNNTKIIWGNSVQEIDNRDKNGKLNKVATDKVNFPKNTSFDYHHLPYFLSNKSTSLKSIKCWLDILKSSPEIAKSSPRESILFSIEEYEKVIERLTPRYKKNIMNLSEFYKQHNEQSELLSFILEAKKSANDIIALEFSSQLRSVFDLNEIDYSETLLDDFDSFVQKVKYWIEKKGNKDSWKDLELILKEPSETDKGIKFLLGVEHGYYGFYDEKNSIASYEVSNIFNKDLNISFKDFNQISPKKSVRKLLENGQIPELIKAINVQLKLIIKNS